MQFSSDCIGRIKNLTSSDPVLVELRNVIITGWPERQRELPKTLHSYWSCRDELSIEGGLIVKGERIVIPEPLQPEILAKMHEGHQGEEKCCLRAKSCVFWVGINQDIKSMVKACDVCQTFQNSQTREPLLPHEIPTRAWQVVGTDLFYFNGSEYLLVVDYYSKFPFMRKLPKNPTSQSVVACLKAIFSEQGIPEKVISDNGPHFDCAAFHDFAQTWEFDQVTSSPHYAQSNGMSERFVQTVKKTLKKLLVSHSDVAMALLCIRTTPIDHKLPTPAELLYGRKLKSNLPIKITNTYHDADGVAERLKERQDKQRGYYDQQSRELPPLHVGQSVRVQDPNSKLWSPATIQAKCSEPRSYLVEKPNGSVLRRNSQFVHSHEPVQGIQKHVRFADEPSSKPDTPIFLQGQRSSSDFMGHHDEPSDDCHATGPPPSVVPSVPTGNSRSHAKTHVASNAPYHTHSGRAVNPRNIMDL